MRDALFAAGAGRIGEYERCSWYAEGTGTFLGWRRRRTRRSASVGVEERVPELRLETVFPEERAGRRGRGAARARTRTRSPRSTSTRSL